MQGSPCSTMECSHRWKGKCQGRGKPGKSVLLFPQDVRRGWLIKEGNEDKGKKENNKDCNEALTFSSLPSSIPPAPDPKGCPSEDKDTPGITQGWTESFSFLPGLSILLHMFTVNRVQGADFLIVLRSQVQVFVSLQGKTVHSSQSHLQPPPDQKPSWDRI